MNAWEHWKSEHIGADGKHLTHRDWRLTGEVWFLERSDGWETCHKYESPYPFWHLTVEESLRVADEFVPLGTAFPKDTETAWSVLWTRDRAARRGSQGQPATQEGGRGVHAWR